MARQLIIVFLFCVITTETVLAALKYNVDKTMQQYMENMAKQMLDLTTRISKHQEELAHQNAKIAQQNTKFAYQNTQIANQKTQIANQKTQIANQIIQIAEQNTKFAKLNNSCSIDNKKKKELKSKRNEKESCFCGGNIALNKPAAQSSTYDGNMADRAVDGNSTMSFISGSCSHTDVGTPAWWCVDLIREYNISLIEITNRDIHQAGLAGFSVKLSTTGSCDANGYQSSKTCYTEPGVEKDVYSVSGCTGGQQMSGRYVFIAGTQNYLTLCEVKMYNN